LIMPPAAFRVGLAVNRDDRESEASLLRGAIILGAAIVRFFPSETRLSRR
jgi:hypothetical protein